MFLKNYWYVAAWGHELGRDPLARTLLNEAVVMYRREDGTPVAFADRCCHRQAPLSLGRVVGDDIQCGYHGMTFDSQGECVAVPGQSTPPPGTRLKSYPITERWQWIWIWMGDPELADEADIPNIYWHDHPDWAVVGDYLHMKCDYQLLVDNLLDLTHETFLHQKTIGNEHVANTPLAKVSRGAAANLEHSALKDACQDENGVTATRWMLDIDPPPLYAKAGGFDKPGDRVDRWQIIRFEPPSHVWLDVGVAAAGTGALDGDRSKGITHTVVDAITPETDTTTHYFWTFPRNYRVKDAELDEFLHVGVQNTFYEDQEMLEGQQRNLDANPDIIDVDINADGASIQARNAVIRLLEQEQTLREKSG